MKIKAIALVRVSTAEQAKNNDSIEGQRRYIQKWANKNNIEIENFYFEPGHSAFADIQRPTLNEILHDVRNNIYSPKFLLVYKFSRFTRKAENTNAFKKELRKNGTIIRSVSEPMPEDEDSAFISGTIIDMVNELSSRDTSKIVQDRLNDTAANSFFTGGVIPFGYQSVSVTTDQGVIKKKLKLNEEEVETVKLIYKLADIGINGEPMGVKAIAVKLNSEGHSYRGKKWHIQAICRILNRTTYYGEYVFGTKRNHRQDKNPPIIVKVPAIITKKDFNRVQKGLASRRPLTKQNIPINTQIKSIRSKTLLTGLLKCKCCGENLKISKGKSGAYSYYKCCTQINVGVNECSCPIIPRDKLDKAIINSLIKHVLNEKQISEIMNEITTNIHEITKNDKYALLKISKKQIDLELKIDRMYDFISKSIIPPDSETLEYLAKLKRSKALNEEKVDLLKQRIKLPLKKFGTSNIKAFINATKKVFSTKNVGSVKQLLISLIDKIEVADEKITVFGPKYKLIELVSKTKIEKEGTPSEVPSFVSIWR